MTPLLVAFAVLLGLARSAAPGPANAEALLRAREPGGRPRAALVVHAGALAGDLGWAVLAALGLAMMLGDPTLRAILQAAGGLLLVASGLGALRAVATDTGEPEIDPSARRPGLGPFAAGVGVAGARVLAPVLWLGVGAWLDPRLPLGGGAEPWAAFLAAAAAGSLAWAIALTALLARRPALVTPGLLRAVDAAAGVVLVGLGVVVLAGMAGRLPGAT